MVVAGSCRLLHARSTSSALTVVSVIVNGGVAVGIIRLVSLWCCVGCCVAVVGIISCVLHLLVQLSSVECPGGVKQVLAIIAM